MPKTNIEIMLHPYMNAIKRTLVELPAGLKTFILSIIGACVSLWLLSGGEYVAELLEDSVHTMFELLVATSVWVLLVDRYLLKKLELGDLHNYNLPGVTRAGIALAWAISFYAFLSVI